MFPRGTTLKNKCTKLKTKLKCVILEIGFHKQFCTIFLCISPPMTPPYCTVGIRPIYATVSKINLAGRPCISAFWGKNQI